jgi:hypothetical protein
MKRAGLCMSAIFLSLGTGCSGGGEPLDGGTVADTGATPADTGVEADAGVEDTGAGGQDAAPEDGGVIDPTTEPFRTVRDNGTPASRIDIVVIGDGYTVDELASTYADHADIIASAIFGRNMSSSTQPFREYSDYFNVHRVHLASNESGVDGVDGDKDTALDGISSCGSGLGARCLANIDKVHSAIDAALAGSGITPDWRVLVLNTNVKGAAGVLKDPRGNIAVFPGAYGATNLARELAMRELAAAFAHAAYEYGGAGSYTGGEPDAPNATLDPTGAKWARWAGHDEMRDNISAVGAYEGGLGFDTGVYRPTDASKMGPQTGNAALRFNAVVREALILSFYEAIPMILEHEPNDQPVTDPIVLWIQPVNRDHTTVEWTVGSTVAANQTDVALGVTDWARLNGIPPGTYTVSARVYDDNSWVRIEPRTRMEETISWQVTLTR